MASLRVDEQMTLARLVEGLVSSGVNLEEIPVSGISMDSREVNAGDLFIAVSGSQTDGKKFISDAIARGAVAVLVESDSDASTPENQQPSIGIPLIAVDHLRSKVSEIAARFYAQPSERIQVDAVTGTNGKTSVAYWLADVYRQLGQRSSVMGTLGCGELLSSGLGSAATETGMTTPDPIEVQRLLANLADAEIDCCAMEVSSHALDQHRIDATHFRAALFTNLSRDHLDYHADMDAYGNAKARLFSECDIELAVINLDDRYAKTLLSGVPQAVPVLTYSLRDKSADLYAVSVRSEQSGITAQLRTPWGEAELFVPVWGEFNLSNLMAVIAAACDAGNSLVEVIAAIANIDAVPGRLQRVSKSSTEGKDSFDIEVVVDYAHTPDAVEKALAAARHHHSGSIITLVGCGGDRDQGKRPLMGAAASSGSDQLILTSDNPRSEPPVQILQEILSGVRAGQPVKLIEDRKTAIESAVAEANRGDLVLILGKGHEEYQQVGNQKLPFSDSQIARAALQRRQQERAVGGLS